MANSEVVEEAVEVRLALLVDGGDQIGGRNLRPALARQQLFLGQPEDVGGRLEKAVAEEILDMGDPEPLDVEGVAGDEVAKPLDPLDRADETAGAAHVDLAFLANRVRPAFRAFVGGGEGG